MTASQFRDAAGQAGLPADWTERVWTYLDAQPATPPLPGPVGVAGPSAPRKFPVAEIFTWLGGLLVLAAVSWAVGLAAEESGVGGVLVTLTVALVVMLIVRVFVDRKDQQLGSDLLLMGLLTAFAVWIFAFFDWTGAWFQPSADQGRLMNLLTDGAVPIGLLVIGLGVAAGWRNRFTLLAWPVIAGGFIGFFGLVLGVSDSPSDHWIVVLGAAFFIIGWALDFSARRGQAFWFHLFGLLIVAADIINWDYWEPPRIGLTFLMAVVSGVVAVLLGRMVYLVAAVIALHSAVGWAIIELFGGSILAPIALFFVGLSVLGVGLKLTLARGEVEAWVLRRLPPGLVELGARPDR